MHGSRIYLFYINNDHQINNEEVHFFLCSLLGHSLGVPQEHCQQQKCEWLFHMIDLHLQIYTQSLQIVAFAYVLCWTTPTATLSLS